MNERATDVGQVSSRVDVLVVGAGPTGLVLAIELVARGTSVQVIDAAAQHPRGSRGKGVQPRTLEVFDSMGVAGRVLANGRFRIPLRKHMPGGETVDHFLNGDVNEPDAATPYNRTLIVAQHRTERILRERLAQLGVAVRLGCRLADLAQDDSGVTAVIESDGRRERIRAAYLVGCDGASSTVRKLTGTAFLGHTAESMRMLTADLVLEGLDRDFWHMWPKPDTRLLALCPLPGLETYQMQVQVPHDTAEDLSIEEVQSVIDDLSDGAGIRVREVRWQSLWRHNSRLASRYRIGRVFLAGDAAHVHPPAGGQGLNTGIQDAYNLGWKLAHVVRGMTGREALLDSYEEERRPIAAEVLGISDGLFSEGLSGVVPVGGQGDTLQLTLHYRSSSLSIDDPALPGALRAGDRLPDGRLDDGRRLFELLRHTHTTLLATGPSAAHRAATRPDLPQSRLHDAVTLAGLGLAEEDVLIVVRPDGYVGARIACGDPEPLSEYLARLGA